MAAPEKTTNPLASLGGVIGAVAGWGISHYVGPALWIPGLATILLLVIFTKTPVRPKFFAGAISITLGHVIWFVAACLATNAWEAVGLDILILVVGVLWLWLWPGLGGVLFLGLVQLGSLVYNGYMLYEAPVGSVPFKGLIVHCLWRLMALAALVVGYVKLRKERAAAVTGP